MPRMNGRQLADQAWAFNPALKVLFTTGYALNAVVHNGIGEPSLKFLSKPYSLDQLANKVRDALAN